MEKSFHPALYEAYDYLSILGLKLIHLSKKKKARDVILAPIFNMIGKPLANMHPLYLTFQLLSNI